MKLNWLKWTLSGVMIATPCLLFAQQATTNANIKAAASSSNIEVLTRGPIHEAFATQYQMNAVAGAKIEAAPPALIDEIAPNVRPAGANVTWIPGYWAWDIAAKDFLWVSGTWRNSPPNHRWTPGYWNRVDGGYQWMSGFWLPATQAQVNYYAAPPQSLERGPTSQAPSQNHFWIPGCYVPNNGRYAWQPGYWGQYQQNYVWTPACNVMTAGGYIYIPGYWDLRLDQRGTLFAPAYINLTGTAANAIRYTPQAVIPVQALQFHLFAQANSSTYLFGNYYGAEYASLGLTPWYAGQIVQGVPDPLFGYYNWMYAASGSNYLDTLTKWNTHFVNNVALRPATTLVGQADLLAKVGTQNVTQTLLAAPLTDIVAKTPTSFVNLSAAEQTSLLAATNGLRVLSAERLKVEGGAVGLAGVSGAANTSINLATQPLQLPAVALPAVTAPVAPLLGAPGQVLPAVPNVVPGVVPNVVPDVPSVLPDLPILPGLPF